MSVTVIVAVCPPGAKSKTLMVSTSRPVEHNDNDKVSNDVSLYWHITTTRQERFKVKDIDAIFKKACMRLIVFDV